MPGPVVHRVAAGPTRTAPLLPPPPRRRGTPLAPPPRRPRAPLGIAAAALVFVGLFAVAAGLGAATGVDLAALFRGADRPPPREFPVLEPSRPVSLSIPSVDLRASVLPVGLAADGSVAVPPLSRHRDVGWFDRGPTPGQFGPAVLVGHADTRTGPSVFHEVPRLRPGNRIEVRRADGSRAVFEVRSVEHFGKAKLPLQRVYGDYQRPGLRLITCGGEWLGGNRGYSDNIVVFADLVDARDP